METENNTMVGGNLKRLDIVSFTPSSNEVYVGKVPRFGTKGIVVLPNEVNTALQTVLGVDLPMSHVAFKHSHDQYWIIAVYTEDLTKSDETQNEQLKDELDQFKSWHSHQLLSNTPTSHLN